MIDTQTQLMGLLGKPLGQSFPQQCTPSVSRPFPQLHLFAHRVGG